MEIINNNVSKNHLESSLNIIKTTRNFSILEEAFGKYTKLIIKMCMELEEVSKNYDVLIFPARKSICFFSSLLSEDILNLNHCLIKSDRVLAYDQSWLKDKKALVFDEGLISGTTLKEIKADLVDAGAIPSIYVLAVNSEFWNKDYFCPDYKYTELPHHEYSDLSSRVVRYMSLVPRPYSIDWPVFNLQNIKDKKLNAFRSLPQWNFIDCSSELHKKHDMFLFTFEPDSTVLTKLFLDLGWHYEGQPIAKIRIYGRKSIELHSSDLKLVPIFILDALPIEVITNLFNCLLVNSSSLNSTLPCHTLNNETKYVFIQTFLAHRIANLLIKNLEKLHPDLGSFVIDYRDLGFNLHPDYSKFLINLLEHKNDSILYDALPFFINEHFIPSRDYCFKCVDPMDPVHVTHGLTGPFTDLFNDVEIPKRETLKQAGHNILQDSISNDTQRLKKGYSVNDLLQGMHGVPEEKRLIYISQFLDYSIDKGTIVPILEEREYKGKKYLVRSFRHGEESPVAENVKRLTIAFLKGFVEATGSRTIGRTKLEKALVLFFRYALEIGVVTEEEPTPNSNISYELGIRYRLYGAMVEVGSNELYEYDGALSFCKHLSSFEFNGEKILGLSTRPNSYYINKVQNKNTLREIKRTNGSDQAEAAGQVIGKVYTLKKSNNRLLVNRESAAYIATCYYKRDTIFALSAELFNYTSRLEKAKVRQILNQSSYSDNIFNFIHKEAFFESIRSGVDKFNQVLEKKITHFVHFTIKDKLNALEKCHWDVLFTKKDHLETPLEKKKQNMLFLELGGWLCDARQVQLIWQICVLYLSKQSIDNSILIEIQSNLKTVENTLEKKELSDIHILSENLINYLNNAPQTLFDTNSLLNIQQQAIDLLFKLNSKCQTLLFEVNRWNLSEKQIKAHQPASTALAIYLEGECSILEYEKGTILKILEDYSCRIRESRVPKSARKTIGVTGRQGIISYKNDQKFCQSDTSGSHCFVAFAKGKSAEEWLSAMSGEIQKNLTGKSKCLTVLYQDIPKGYGVDVSDDNFDPMHCLPFQLLQEQVFYELTKDEFESSFIIIQADGQQPPKSLRQTFSSTFMSTIREHRFSSPIIVETPSLQKLQPSRYEVIKDRSMLNNQLNKADIGICCITATEASVVSQYFKEYGSNYKAKIGETTGNYFYSASLQSSSTNKHKVVMTQAINQGNMSIKSAAQHIVQEFAPKLLVIVGIAGSIHDDIDIGDVVLVSNVFYIDRRAETNSGTVHRTTPYNISAKMNSIINRFLVAHGGEEAKFPNPKGEIVKCLRGPLAATEGVLKSEKSPTRKAILKVNDKVLAVDMESAGFLDFGQENMMSNTTENPDFLIVRGISDKANSEKADDAHKIASFNAMATLARILEMISPDTMN